MTKKESLAFLDECMKELENAGEKDKKRMRQIYYDEYEKEEKMSLIRTFDSSDNDESGYKLFGIGSLNIQFDLSDFKQDDNYYRTSNLNSDFFNDFSGQAA